jgi:putative cell wall-binding protein/glucose/arabinose dehydrogenase
MDVANHPPARRGRAWHRAAAVLAGVLVTAAATAVPSVPASAQSADFPVVQLPPGFSIEKVVDGLTYATSVTWDDQGRMYVAEAGGVFVERPVPARIMRVENGQATELVNLTANGIGAAVVGLTYHDGHLYFTHRDGQDRTGSVSRVSLDGQQVTQVLSGIIDSQSEHQVNDLVVGPDGTMYLSSGMAGNAAVLGLDTAAFTARSPQVRATPCRDLVLTGRDFVTPDFRTQAPDDLARTGAYVPFGTSTTPGQRIAGTNKCGGSILAFDPNNAEATVRPIADGLRNVLGLRFDARGEMFVATNGYDIRGSRPVRDDFDGTYKVREGHWYGVPDFSAALEPLTDPKFDAPDSQMAPVFVGDQPQPQSLDFVIDHEASGLTPPDKSLIAGLHEWNSSPSLMDFGPTAWGGLAGQLFVAEWGDLAPATNPLRDKPVGSQVVRLDTATGKLIPFVRNLRRGPASAQGAPGMGIERPFDVKFGPDGAMYIVDFGIVRINPAGEGTPYEAPEETGIVWKVTRTGSDQGVQRIAGQTRAETAAALSRSTFLPKPAAVFVATADDFPDALAAGSAATLAGAPVLLVGKGEIPAATAEELRRLQPSNIVVLGGAAAVADTVITALDEFTSGEVRRISGPTRYETAAMISQQTFRSAPVAYVATGEAFADALTGGVPAAMQAGPVLLVKQGSIPAATASELGRLEPRRIVVLGGTAAVSQEVEAQLRSFTVGSVTRQAGGNRFSTAAAVAERTFPVRRGHGVHRHRHALPRRTGRRPGGRGAVGTAAPRPAGLHPG